MLARGTGQAPSPTGITTGNREQKNSLKVWSKCSKSHMSLWNASLYCLTPKPAGMHCVLPCITLLQAPRKARATWAPLQDTPHSHGGHPHLWDSTAGRRTKGSVPPHPYQNWTELPPQSISSPTASCATTFPRWKSFSVMNASTTPM